MAGNLYGVCDPFVAEAGALPAFQVFFSATR